MPICLGAHKVWYTTILYFKMSISYRTKAPLTILVDILPVLLPIIVAVHRHKPLLQLLLQR